MLKLQWENRISSRHAASGESIIVYGDDARAAVADSQSVPPPAPVIGVLGAKGGVGATSLAVNLALALSRQFGRGMLVDANLQQPDVATMLAREPEYSLLDLVHRSGELDASLLEACSLEVSGKGASTRLLSPPLSGEAVAVTNLSAVAAIIEGGRRLAGVFVVDLPRHLDRHLVSMLDITTVIVLTLEPTIGAVAAAKRWLNHLAELGYSRERVICAINRAGGRGSGLIEEQLEAAFAGYALVKVPNSFMLLQSCTTDGEPPVVSHPKDAYSRAVARLGCAIAENGGVRALSSGGGFNG